MPVLDREKCHIKKTDWGSLSLSHTHRNTCEIKVRGGGRGGERGRRWRRRRRKTSRLGTIGTPMRAGSKKVIRTLGGVEGGGYWGYSWDPRVGFWSERTNTGDKRGGVKALTH